MWILSMVINILMLIMLLMNVTFSLLKSKHTSEALILV